MATAKTISLPGLGTEANDALLDLVAELEIDPDRRDRQSEKAHRAGLDSCEACGRGLKTEVPVLDSTGAVVAKLGPECAKKIARMLAG